MRSVLPRGSVRGLRTISTAGMRHTARQQLLNSARQPNAEYTKTPTWGPPTCCHLSLMGSKAADIAAARGIEGQWQVKVPDETDIPAGSKWEVVTHRETRLEEVTGDLMRLGKIMRLVAAKDTVLNR